MISASLCTDNPQTLPTNYFDDTKFDYNNNNKIFPCLLTNIQSIYNKFSKFLHVVDHYHPTIIAITESWCTDSTCNAEMHIPDYSVFHKDRKSRAGGGVLLYIHVGLPAKPVRSLISTTRS